MNKKVRSILFLLIASIVLTLPAVFSYMIKQTEVVNNQFEVINVECDIEESVVENVKTKISVKNKSNVETYIRLKIVHFMQDSKGNIVGRNSVLDSFLLNSDDWIYNSIEDIYYYKEPVEVGKSTTSLLKTDSTETGIILDTYKVPFGDVDFSYYQAIEIHAEAIQSLPAKAVEDSWGVFVDEETGSLSLTK